MYCYIIYFFTLLYYYVFKTISRYLFTVTESVLFVSALCLHYISPSFINGKDPAYVNDIIVQPISDNSTIVYFNGPTELLDIIIGTEEVEEFTLNISEDGETFTSYMDSNKDKLVRSSIAFLCYLKLFSKC